MEGYADVLGHYPSMQIAHAHLSRRSSQRVPTRTAPLASRPSRVEKSASKHTSPNDIVRRRTATYMHDYRANPQQLPPFSQLESRDGYNMARAERPLSWHATSHEALEYPSYFFQQPATIQSTPSAMSGSSYDWPDDNKDSDNHNSTLSNQPLLPVQTFQSYTMQQPATQYHLSQPTHQQTAWMCQSREPTSAYPMIHHDTTHQPYSAAKRVPATNHHHAAYNTQEWQEQELEAPGLEEDISPGAHGEEELVGLGLYEDSAPCTGRLGSGGSMGLLRLTEPWAPPISQAEAGSNVRTGSDNHCSPPYSVGRDYENQAKVPQSSQSLQPYPHNLTDHSWMYDQNNGAGVGWYDGQYATDAGRGYGVNSYY